MHTRVKICGIRTIKAAEAAVEAGADFLGFNFVPSSKRYITPSVAKDSIDEVRGGVKIVGVFKDQPIQEVNALVRRLALDYVQLHGEEIPSYCDQVLTETIKAFSLPSDFDSNETIQTMKQYSVMYYMVDRKKQGEGAMLDLLKVHILARLFPLFFAGGLTLKNVAEVVRAAQPYAVDVASGIETEGKEDVEKIRAFIKEAKGVFA